MYVFVKLFSGRTLCLQLDACHDSGENVLGKVADVEGIPAQNFTLYHHGNKVSHDDIIEPGEWYQALLSLKGGKGGFGSMLRMIGAQIDKTTNHDACRDLSGRRMRDVNNEKQLSEWITKKEELEREKVEKRREKLERLRHEPKHYFVDPNYDKQKQEVIENLSDAITQGIQAAATAGPSASSSRPDIVKRKAETGNGNSSKKSRTMWMGVEDASDSDNSDLDEELPSPKMTHATPEESSSSASSSSTKSTPSPSSSTPAPSPPHQDKDLEPTSKANGADTDRLEADGDRLQIESGHGKDGNSLLSILPEPTHLDKASNEDSDNKDSDNKDSDNKDSDNKDSKNKEPESVDLDDFSSVTELESLGLETLKSALMARGMKCGGTLQQRAERLFLVKGVSLDEIDTSLLAKPSKGKRAKGK